jgi:hypothetical protein
MFSWANHYRRLFDEAMERARQASEPSVAATYREMAKDWFERFGAGRAEREIGGRSELER